MKYPFSGIVVRFVRATPEAPETIPLDELHVNLWEVTGRRFVDIGVMINDPENVRALQVDLPWVFDKSKVFDLGSRLVGERIVAAIFNEVVRYTGSNDDSFARVSFPPDTNTSFVLARLNSTDFNVEHVLLSDGGTTTKLHVKLPDIGRLDEPVGKLYVRFRIVDIAESSYTAKFYQRDRNLLSSSLETRIVDFRINVRRGLPDDVLTSQQTLRFPRWNKIHLFLTFDRVREMTFTSENFVACRSLVDEAIWNNYIVLDSTRERQCSVSNYLGYQWTAKAKKSTEIAAIAPAKDLVALARFSQVTSSGWYMVRFLILALAVGAAGNGVWDLGGGHLPVVGDDVKTSAMLWFVVLIVATVFVTPVGATRVWKRATTAVRKFLVRIGGLFREE